MNNIQNVLPIQSSNTNIDEIIKQYKCIYYYSLFFIKGIYGY